MATAATTKIRVRSKAYGPLSIWRLSLAFFWLEADKGKRTWYTFWHWRGR